MTQAAEDLSPPRQLPELEPETAFFWTSGADGKLRILRCEACGRYQHPPLPLCPACGGDRMSPAVVSGRGRVATFSINRQVWIPGLTVPYVFAAIELAEQAELYVFTNIEGCPPEAARSGLPVEVFFEQHEDVFLPLFKLVDGADAR